ncbi:uncharacterized protein [Euphorbia lathyris]|uniref:uncharacterized protein n=1 Tax=Euphorbia lathyris TaxID=212925 RepID=UPI00331375A8
MFRSSSSSSRSTSELFNLTSSPEIEVDFSWTTSSSENSSSSEDTINSDLAGFSDSACNRYSTRSTGHPALFTSVSGTALAIKARCFPGTMASSSIPPRKKNLRAESTPSRMSAVDLADLANRYPWINNYETQLAAAHQRPSCPPRGFLTVYYSHVERGFRLPLPKMMADILSYFDITASQLHPNGWLDIALDCYLASNLGVVYTGRVFRAFHKPSQRKSESYLTFAKFGAYSPFSDKMSNVHCWDEKFFYVKIKEGESLGFPSFWNPKPLHMADDMRILTDSDEVVAELMKKIKVDAWTYADALAFMMSDIPLIRREGDQFIYSKITQFDQEKRRKFLEAEARRKDQAANP